MKSKYPEINALNAIYIKHKVEIRFSRTDFLAGDKDYRKSEFTIGGKTFSFYVEDEYDEMRYNYPLLNLCLVLRELEYYAYYAESDDYLLWCKEHQFEPENIEVLAHFKGLAVIYREIELIIGKIDSFISDWDFEMGSGASSELRKQI